MEDFLRMKYVVPVAELVSVEAVDVLLVSPQSCPGNNDLPYICQDDD